MPRLFWLLVITSLILLLEPRPALAYIGPGAGFAVLGSFLAVFAALFSAVLMVLSWPFRWIARWLFRRRPPANRRFKRVVILGLDGLDHGLTEKMLAQGRLPHLAALRDQGCFKPLASTLPPISPVAWSSFQTGVNPGKHNIFDFLFPDASTYQPRLSSVEIRPPTRRIRLAGYEFPLAKSDIRLLRKSRPFWSVLSDYGILNCIIRVPITFPPEKLHGVQLSAMCVPDLRGTQGEFSRLTSRESVIGEATGGLIQQVVRNDRCIHSHLVGPPHPLRKDAPPLSLPLTVEIVNAEQARLTIGRESCLLQRGVYSDWVPVCFRGGFGFNVHGVCRFLLLETEPHFDLYVTPININPEKPAMPIGYPDVYSVYLAKRQGQFATLGLAEDTWGLSEEVLSDEQFEKQCRDIDQEREQMFFDGLDKTPEGLCVCVFDGTDRMQHMFWRYLEADHPARPAVVSAASEKVIENLYTRMDGLVGRTVERCNNADTLLLVISDHGFNSFRRGIDLNRWLEEQGYLKVDESRRQEQYLAGIDWSQTRAFALGLTGIFINTRGKFAQGIVAEGAEVEALRTEIAQKLASLVDPATGERGIRRVHQAARAYQGPYKEHAPDLIVGYERGYRVSWDAAIGKTSTQIFHDNTKAWSGDHCVDPSVVPGVLFCNRKITTEHPRLLDLGATVLNLFGISTPDYMDGRPLEVADLEEVNLATQPSAGQAVGT
ncbi:MAG: alkaline phosphatase family protein [Planctomycetes bacterium]|nr:alkaline phosphatase family protein [Planctomycetota bacterium]